MSVVDHDDLTHLFLRFRDRADSDALAEVFDRAAPSLLRVGAHLLGDAIGAEDLVQQTFITAIERAKTFRQDAPLRPWLFGILIRHARNERRRRERARPRSAPPENSPSACDDASNAELRREIASALDSLSAPYREVVTASLLDEAKPREIATGLHRAPALVRLQLHRGMQFLRDLLSRRGAPAWIVLEPTRGVRGIASLRHEILLNARHAASPAAWSAKVGAAGSGLSLGSWIMGKKAIVVGSACILALCAVIAVEALRSTAEAKPIAVAAMPVVATLAPTPAPEPVVAAPIERTIAVADPPRVLEPLTDQASRGDGVVVGRVVIGDSTEAVADARVAAWVGIDTGRPTCEALTDSEGSFRLTSVDFLSTVFLTIDAEGFSTRSVGLDEAAPNSTSRDGELNLGLLRIERGESVEGVVRDSTGVPVRDAEVRIADAYGPASTFLPAGTRHGAVTDASGRFEIRNVAPTRENNLWRIYAVAKGEIGGVRIRVPRGIGSVKDCEIRLSPVSSLKVHVANENGEPIAGAQVQAEPRFEPWIEMRYLNGKGPEPVHGMKFGSLPSISGLFTATTDARGNASLPRLPSRRNDLSGEQPALYDVFVRAEGRQDGAADGIPLEVGKIGEAGKEREVTIALEPLQLRSIEGTITGSDSHPVADATVYLSRVDGGRRWLRYPDARSDALGRFRFDGIAALGEFHVGTRPIDCLPFSTSVEISAKSPLTLTVDLRARRSYTIQGRLVDQFDHGVPYAMLEADDPEAKPGVSSTMTRTGPDGSFELWTPLPGEQTIHGRQFEFPAGQWTDSAPSWTAKGGARNVKLVVQRAAKGVCEVTANIVDALDGSKVDVKNAWFEPDPSGDTRVQVRPTISIGRVVANELAAGAWTLRLATAEHAPFDYRFTIAPGSRSERFDVAIPRPAILRVRIALPAGKERECFVGSSRGICHADGGEVRGFRVKAGETTSMLATAGPVTLTVEGRRLLAEPRVVEAKVGESFEVVLDATVGGTLQSEGFSQLAAGVGAFYAASGNGAYRLLWTKSRQDGDKYEMGGTVPVGAGKWRFCFLAGATDAAPETLPVWAEGDYSVDIDQTAKIALPSAPRR